MSQDLQLIQNVELRFALADSTEKFQSALNTYLAPLLLKFAVDDTQVRTQLAKTIKFLLSKINATSELKLPAQSLLNQIREPNLKPNQNATIVQNYTLLFLSKAITRLSEDERYDIFFNLLNNISGFTVSVAARLFNISCKVLELSPDANMDRFSSLLECLPEKDKQFLEEKYFKFMLLHPVTAGVNGSISNNITQPGLSSVDCSFFFYYAGVTFDSSSLAQYKLKILKFVENAVGIDKSIILICASCDSDSRVSSYASTCLKRLTIDYESEELIGTLADLFIGSHEKPPVKSHLQEAFLSIFCKSKIAARNDLIEKISPIGLNSENLKLKQATVSFVRWYTTVNSLDSKGDDTAKRIGDQLKLNLSNVSTGGEDPYQIENRRFQYETLGLLLKKSKKLLDFSYIQFLIDMLDIESKDLKPTIMDALLGITLNLSSLTDEDKLKLKNLFVDIFKKGISRFSDQSTNFVRFIAIKYTNILFPFEDALSRALNILGQSIHDKIETIEESKRGLNPYLFSLDNANTGEEIRFPQFHAIVKCIIEYRDLINAEVALSFAVRSLIMNSISYQDTVVAIDQYWETRVDQALNIDPVVKKSLLSSLETYVDLDGRLTNDYKSSALKQFIDFFFNSLIQSNKLSSLITLYKIISLCPPVVTDSLTVHISFLMDNDFENMSNESYHYISQLTGIICTSFNVSNNDLVSIVNKLLEEESISPLAYVISRLYLRGRRDVLSEELLLKALGLVEKHLNTSSTKSLEVSLDAISQFSMFGCLNSTSAQINNYKETFIKKIQPLVKKCLEPAVYAWCYLGLTMADETFPSSENTMFEEAIYATYLTKQIDNLFALGEGLAILSDGWSSKNMKGLIDIPGTVLSIEFYPKRCEPILNNVLAFCDNPKPSLRKAGCIWLLSMVQYCTDDIIISRLEEIQKAFMRCLSDREEIIQDAASRGLSITYGMGSYEVKEALVHDLLGSFTDSNKATKDLISGYVDNDTQLFDEGVMNTGGGESVSTYKDVLNLASEVGNPGLVYKFMSLAKNSALWSSKKGIAFGLSAILDKEQLDKLLKDNPNLSRKLIPKLFRYKYDPNTSISRTMNNIWNSLILNNKKTLDDNYDNIFNELLNGMGNREWRIREASTAALQDLLSQCDFDKFKNSLETIWMMAFRAMDDIKSSVRKEGASLTRFLANIMVMKLNNSLSKSGQEAILKQLIPFFLGNSGLLSDAEDVKKFAFETLMKLISTSSQSLKPFISEIVKQLILLMSSVEPQAINYLTLNADKYNLKIEDIDSHRLGAVGSSPLMEAIEKLMDLLDESNISNFIEELEAAVKTAVGLPSKVAGSKVIVILIMRHFFIIGKHGDQLLKIASSQMKDRNETVAKSYAIACGYCIRVASNKKIGSFGKKVTRYYFEKRSDSGTDDKLPKVSSIACESVSNFSGDQFQSHASLFLPLAFIAKHDLNKEIAKTFSKVWSDYTNSSVSAIKLFFPEIINLINSHINTPAFALRRTIALTIIEIIDVLDIRINELNPGHLAELYKILLESLDGRIYDGKEKLLDSLVNLACKSSSFLSKNDELYQRVEERVVFEANRKNKQYQKFSVLALGKLLSVYHEKDSLYDQYVNLVDQLLESSVNDSDDSDDDGDITMRSDSTPIKKTSLVQVNLAQAIILNLIQSLSNGNSINEKVLRYTFDTTITFLKSTSVDLLPTSDAKFKLKQGILSILTRLVELNKPGLINNDWYNDKVIEVWEIVGSLTSTTDNLQPILVGFARVSGLILNQLQIKDDYTSLIIRELKILSSENVSPVVTIECDKILSKFK